MFFNNANHAVKQMRVLPVLIGALLATPLSFAETEVETNYAQAERKGKQLFDKYGIDKDLPSLL